MKTLSLLSAKAALSLALALLGWSSVMAQPRTVTAVAAPNNSLCLFKVGADGGIYSNLWDGQWHDWLPISNLAVPPESVVTAAAGANGNVNLFVVGSHGGIYTS